MEAQLSKLEKRILEELQTAQSELTRSELAKRLGRNALYPHDINLLEGLVARGLVNKREETRGAVATVNHYRAK